MFAAHSLCSILLILRVAMAEATEPVRVIRETVALPTTTWPLGEGARGIAPIAKHLLSKAWSMSK